MSGFGIGGWGIGPWGGMSVASLAFALATSTRTVEVVLTGDAYARSEIALGDALNPASWRLVEALSGTPVTVLGVRVIQPNSVFELDTLQDLADVFTDYVVDATGVISVVGNVPLAAPLTYQLAGLMAAPEFLGSNPVPHDLGVIAASPSLGGEVLAMTGRGGYVRQTGVALLRKLIERRLCTTPGAYFHLPDYGLGLSAKRLIRPSELGQLQAAIEQQTALEPDVQSAKAKLRLDANGTLTVMLAVVSRTLGALDPYPLVIAGGS